MTSRFHVCLSIGLAAVLVLIAPAAVRADLEIGYSPTTGLPTPPTPVLQITFGNVSVAPTLVDGGAPPPLSGVVSFSPVAGVSVTFASAQSTQAANGSNLFTAVVSIVNSNPTGSATFFVDSTQTFYSLPGSAGSTDNVDSNASFNVAGTSSGTGGLTVKSWASNLNTLYGIGAGTVVTNALGTIGPGSMASSNVSSNFTRTGGFYDLTVQYMVTLAANSQLNYSATLSVTPTPAPAGLVLALTALPALGFGGWWSRKRKQAA